MRFIDHACATACDFITAYENIEIITRSHPDAFPSSLRQKRKTQTKIHQGKVLPKVRLHTSIHPGVSFKGLRCLKNVPHVDTSKHSTRRNRCAPR